MVDPGVMIDLVRTVVQDEAVLVDVQGCSLLIQINPELRSDVVIVDELGLDVIVMLSHGCSDPLYLVHLCLES